MTGAWLGNDHRLRKKLLEILPYGTNHEVVAGIEGVGAVVMYYEGLTLDSLPGPAIGDGLHLWFALKEFDLHNPPDPYHRCVKQVSEGLKIRLQDCAMPQA